MNNKNWLLALLSGCLFWLSWVSGATTVLIFFAFVPLLILAAQTPKRYIFARYVYVAMLIWNVGVTWWIWNSTNVGSVAAMMANSALMSLPLLAYHWFWHRFQPTNRLVASVAFVVCWMSFEYLHLNWELSWPWLTVGNVFAMQTNWVQWYECTGVAGGTVWVLVVNLLFYLAFNPVERITFERISLFKYALPIGVMVIPILISYVVAVRVVEKGTNKITTLIVQPNIDPYEKFNASTVQQQIDKLLLLSRSADSSVGLLVWPETAMNAYDNQQAVTQNPFYQPIMQFLGQRPQATLISGIEMYREYGLEKATKTARKSESGVYYDAMNAAVSLNAKTNPQFYCKSKLVPGVEHLPSFFNFVAPIFEQFGGSTGGYGMEAASKNLPVAYANNQVAPIICYESIYGAYVTSYVKKGASLLTIVTNDGWWGNTPGHKQHLAYARLRAIETRRWVARSANTGISAVINCKGDIVKSLPWDKAGVIKYDIPMTTELTFYVKWGDYLYQLSVILLVLILLVGWFSQKK